MGDTTNDLSTGHLDMPTASLPSRARGSRRSRTSRMPSTKQKPTGDSMSESDIQVKRQVMYGVLNSSTESLCPGYKKVGCFSAGSARNVISTKSTMPPAMEFDDFDSLPPAIRRKYFSSLERLRYAQQSTTSSQKKAGHLRNLSANGRLIGRGRTSADSLRSQTSSLRFRKHRNAANAFLLSQTDAQWFLNLPETIRRKHFSREERILLANKCESIIVDAADETLYRMGRARSLSMDSISTTAETILCRPSFDSDIQSAKDEIRRSFGWMEEGDNLDLNLHKFDDDDDDSDTETPPESPPCRFRRTLSLTSKSLRSNSAASNRTRPSFSSRRTTTSLSRPTTALVRRRAHSNDAEATYYQDPEARLKLRIYLASPQKFDEAIEFGFPSQTDAQKFFHVRPKVATVRKVVPELDDPGTDNEVDVVSTDEPTMPPARVKILEVPEQPPRARSSSSMKSHPTLGHYPHISPGNREWTMRMTLTRKDLRADEKLLYQEKALEMEELPPESETCVVEWDEIDRESQSGLKKLWRMVTGH